MTLAALVHMLPMGVTVDEVGGPVEGLLKTKVTGLTCRDRQVSSLKDATQSSRSEREALTPTRIGREQENQEMTALDSVTYPDSTGDFVLESVAGRWRITHHNVEDDEPTVFEWDSAMKFLDDCGVSRDDFYSTEKAHRSRNS